MNIPKEALSYDGFIINQDETKNIKYGKYNSSYNGCGWIACYNVLKALKCNPKADYIKDYLEKRNKLGGLFGTNINGITDCIKLYLPNAIVKKIVCKNRFKNEIKNARACIIMYWTGGGLHYVCFYPYLNSYRFLNALYGVQVDLRDFEKFMSQEVKTGIPPVLICIY